MVPQITARLDLAQLPVAVVDLFTFDPHHLVDHRVSIGPQGARCRSHALPFLADSGAFLSVPRPSVEPVEEGRPESNVRAASAAARSCVWATPNSTANAACK